MKELKKDGIKRTEDGRIDLEWWHGLSIPEKMQYEVWQAEVPPRGTPGANRRKYLKETLANASTEEILFKEDLHYCEKIFLLENLHNLSSSEAMELIKTTEREIRKNKLGVVKRKLSQKAQELYGCLPEDSKRELIPDDVKIFVWNRDSGKCIKCGSKEKLEFDHVIPVVKGGANTARNIQILCEKCNREKSANI